jgi:hypothetical protein
MWMWCWGGRGLMRRWEAAIADAWDELSRWSPLCTGGEDPGLGTPEGFWDTAVSVALDPETALPADDPLPANHLEVAFDETGAVSGDHEGTDLWTHEVGTERWGPALR